MYKILVIGWTLVFLLVIPTSSFATELPISVVVDGDKLATNTAPSMVKGRVLVPLRGVLEAMGAKVNWDGNNQEISVEKEATSVHLTVGKSTAFIQGKKVSLDVPAMLIKERTFIPLRFLGEATGAIVHWEESGKTVVIDTKSKVLVVKGIQGISSERAVGSNKPIQETKAAVKSGEQVENGAGIFSLEVVKLVNKEREKKGLKPLVISQELIEIAEIKVKEMNDQNYFSHSSPTYGTIFNMLEDSDIAYRHAGENIAKGYDTPEEVVQGWMNSKGHRENILSPKYSEIGVGNDQSYWVQEFVGH